MQSLFGFLVALRAILEFLKNDYVFESQECRNLLEKAQSESFADIRSAYFIKVIEADNQAVTRTLSKNYLGFLSFNSTYASEEDIVSQACQPSALLSDLLSWTAGIVPLFTVWIIARAVLIGWRRCKTPNPTAEKTQEIEMTESDSPPRDSPPRAPQAPRAPLEPLELSPPRFCRDERQELLETEKRGIRRRKDRSKERKKFSVTEKITALSPSLRSRIMSSV